MKLSNNDIQGLKDLFAAAVATVVFLPIGWIIVVSLFKIIHFVERIFS